MWKERFPFWLPLLTTVAIASALAAWDYGIVYYTAVNFAGDDRAQHECRVAASMAARTLAGYRAINIKLAAQDKRALSFGVNPILHGVSGEGQALLPKRIPANVRALFLLVPPIDCSAEFSRNRLPILRHTPYPASPYDNPVVVMVSFSRPVFSTDGRIAYLEQGTRCGFLCGQGFDTRWHLEDGNWVLDRSKATWIS